MLRPFSTLTDLDALIVGRSSVVRAYRRRQDLVDEELIAAPASRLYGCGHLSNSQRRWADARPLRQHAVTGIWDDRHWKIRPGSQHWCGFQRVVTGSSTPPVTTRSWRRSAMIAAVHGWRSAGCPSPKLLAHGAPLSVRSADSSKRLACYLCKAMLCCPAGCGSVVVRCAHLHDVVGHRFAFRV